ncbi:D-alanine--D-alanine ligase family protein [Salidesulfovibrio onnuriiensis]|uniref:D-alanine--D-alanine ligase family protein n=1 Tax=Salidesulfovibrio onnuriiensis TaxID=2583823 RepID=UPI0011CB9214|nr:D-alanine--D-alanine ligase [Salidesulfovibrio onnuriiensis]
MNVLLIAGGWSSEREVSLNGAAIIRAALERLGHSVRMFDPAPEFDSLIAEAKKADFAFINMHGSPGEDGLVQAMLECAGCPYQGPGPAPSFLALNKAASKQVFRERGIPTPDWRLLTSRPESGFDLGLDLPVFAKPNTGGSSVHMGICRDQASLERQLNIIFDGCDLALVESLVPGTELTCGMLGGKALPLIMIRPKGSAEFFDYENKYAADGAEEICPAPVDDAVRDLIHKYTLEANEALGLTGYSRADFMLDENGTPWLLEVNTLPGMTATSLLPQAAAESGLPFDELIAELIRLGMEQRG